MSGSVAVQLSGDLWRSAGNIQRLHRWGATYHVTAHQTISRSNLTSPRPISRIFRLHKDLKAALNFDTSYKMATTAQSQAAELSMLLPKALDTKIHVRLSFKTKALILNLTTASPDELSGAANMGSFVYALPDVSLISWS